MKSFLILSRILFVKKVNFRAEFLLQGTGKCLYAIAFCGVVACGDEDCAGFVGNVVLRLGNLAGDLNFGAFVYGRLKKSLCAAGAPCGTADGLLRIADDGGVAAEFLGDFGSQFGNGFRGFQTAYVQ